MRALLFISLLTLVFPSLCFAQTVYRCVDDKGVTHFGETMPAVCAKKAVTEMSRQGRVIRQLDAPLTQEQQKVRDEIASKKREEDKLIAEQRMKDEALLSSYGVEREFDTLRNRDMAQIDGRQKAVEKRLADHTARLAGFETEMEFYRAGKSKSGKVREPPAVLVANLERSRTEMTSLQIELSKLEKERIDTAARYDVEKVRWKRLKSGMTPGTILDADGKVVVAAPLRRSASAEVAK